MTGATAQDPRSSRRIFGLDAARGLAVLGMIAAHVLPDRGVESIADGRSSVLFATIAGISLGLLSGGSHPPPRGLRGSTRRRVAIRGAVLILLGLLLWTLPTYVAIILDYYGAFFLVALPLLFAPRWLLGLLVALFALVGPLVVGSVPDSPMEVVGSNLLLYLPLEWFVTGYYPGVVWLAYLLLGLLLARCDLRTRRTRVAMLVAGATSALVGYGTAAVLGFDASAHSGSSWEVLGAGGTAVALTGILLLLTDALPVVRRILWPLAAAGSMPLTIYTAQIVVIAMFMSTPLSGQPASMESWPLLFALAAGSLLFASLWRRFLGRGPLERALAAVAR